MRKAPECDTVVPDKKVKEGRIVLATYVDIFVVRASLGPGSSWMLPPRGAMAAACSPERWQHRAEIDEPACCAPLRHLFTVALIWQTPMVCRS